MSRMSCPFCAEEDTAVIRTGIQFVVMCNGCGAIRSKGDSQLAAINMWNVRQYRFLVERAISDLKRCQNDEMVRGLFGK